jgi:hypothetical protein
MMMKEILCIYGYMDMMIFIRIYRYLRIYSCDDDDDVYLHRIHPQHKLENYAPHVKYRPAKKGISRSKSYVWIFLYIRYI